MEKNDIDMFELADESYAVQNAHEDLKKLRQESLRQTMRTELQNGLIKILNNNIEVYFFSQYSISF